MIIDDAVATDLFVGPADAPHQIVQVTLTNTGVHGWTADRPAAVRVVGPSLRTVTDARATDVAPGRQIVVEVGVAVDRRLAPGNQVAAAVEADDGVRSARRELAFRVAEPGWRMFMVSHFHYAPVWWNTQAFYTETWEKLAREERPWEGRKQQPAFTLIDAHLDLARRDPDYCFVLAELDYLKPWWDSFPEQRGYLRQLLAEGRLELMGGTYNEANTNLTNAESTVRNVVYGVGYQRDVLGGSPATAWQLDVFGHDPQFPGLMADAGLTSSSWARGPFHQWGPSGKPGGNLRMQFPSEFDWVAPSGRALLTSYMPNHYSAGWELENAPTLAEAEAEAFRLFRELQPVAATRNVLLPVGTDYTPPNRWITSIHRDWNARYTWPRFEIALPRDFFAAVRAELDELGGAVPQTRDMNPIYTGKDVSYIDTKQAQRAAENRLHAAEAFATVAALLGARFPSEAIDKAWRQLLFNAHHDGITGTESDQVYLDLLGGWRDTWELSGEVLDDALDLIGEHVDTGSDARGQPVVVFNSLSWERTDVVRVAVAFDEPTAGLRLVDNDDAAVPFVVEHPERDGDERLTSCIVAFVAGDVPSVGYRTYRVVPAADLPEAAVWRPGPGRRIRNAAYEVVADPERGGALCEIIDRVSGRSLLKPDGLANELLAYDEYPTHPSHGEGPWHLLPVGTVTSSADRPAEVHVEHSAIGQRLVARSGRGEGVDGCTTVQETTLYAGVPRVGGTTLLDGFTGQDTLLRMRVAADVPGGMPVSDVAGAVIGRGFGFPLVDSAVHPSTLDNPAYTWFGVGATARIVVGAGDARAISIAEIVVADDWLRSSELRSLAVALVRCGVTSTVSRGAGSRYGDIDVDSNLPDVRIAVGRPDENPFVADLLDDPGRARLEAQVKAHGFARIWVPAHRSHAEAWRPGTDLRGARDLPVLVVAGADRPSTAAAIDSLSADLDDAVIVVGGSATDVAGDVDRTVAVFNRGLPGFVVDPDGDLYLSLMRSCSGWPSGVWLDPPRRTVPDGSSFPFQHWTHEFRYALVGGDGDWRRLGVVRAAREHDHPLLARSVDLHHGPLPPRLSFVTVEADDVLVTAIKPRSNPMARMANSDMDPRDGVVVRLQECRGRATEVGVRLWHPVVDAIVTDVLERSTAPAPVSDGVARLHLDAYDIATVAMVPATGDPPTDRSLRGLGRRAEPAQPVFSDYWLHNKGAAPVGYQPVTVHIPLRAVAIDGPVEVPVVVASERTDAAVAGTVEIVVPAGWTAAPSTHPYRLAPGDHATMTSLVEPPDGATSGRYLVAARITDDAGQVHEDVLTVDLGRSPLAVPNAHAGRALLLERATRKAVVVDRAPDPATMSALGGEIEVVLDDAPVVVRRGGRGVLDVVVRNCISAEVGGEAQVISPWGTWEQVRPWTQGFAVAPGETIVVPFTVECPHGPPPTSSWALVKVMYAGRVLYTPSVALHLGTASAS